MATKVEASELTYVQPYQGAGKLPRWLRPLAPADPAARAWLRLSLIRVVIATTLLLGTIYLSWRYATAQRDLEDQRR